MLTAKSLKPLARALSLLLLLCMSLPAPAQTSPQAALSTYDVVSIKPENPDAGAVGFRRMPTGFEAYAVSLKDLIKEAYGLQDVSLVANAPGWKTQYHIIAKMSGEQLTALDRLSPRDQAEKKRIMLQSALADRFRLAVHPGKQPLPVYLLTVDKKGAKLQPAAPNANSGSHAAPAPSFFQDGRIVGVFSMDRFARLLSTARLVHIIDGDRPVVDNTGLPGDYVIDIAWTPLSGANSPSPSPETEVYNSLPSALIGKLGLRLVPETIQADAIIVDHAERPALD